MEQKPNKQFVIIEFQGSLNAESTQVNGAVLSEVKYNPTFNTYEIMIGINQLQGVEEKLEKPLTLTRVKKTNLQNPEEKTLEVVATITKRIIFKNRPVPIMANNPDSTLMPQGLGLTATVKPL